MYEKTVLDAQTIPAGVADLSITPMVFGTREETVEWVSMNSCFRRRLID